MLSVLRDRYHIPFLDSPPHLSRTPISFPTYRAGSPRSLTLRQEVEKMLSKDALEIVLDPGPGFYSSFSLVEKVPPPCDRPLSPERVCSANSVQDGDSSLCAPVRQRGGDFLASIDLKDAYFQIPLHQSSRKLLRFLSEGTVCQFKALCFGLSTTPQVFTNIFAVVSVWAHSHGIPLLRYLDDWLVLASSEAEAKKNIQDLLSIVTSSGL